MSDELMSPQELSDTVGQHSAELKEIQKDLSRLRKLNEVVAQQKVAIHSLLTVVSITYGALPYKDDRMNQAVHQAIEKAKAANEIPVD